MAQSSKKVDPQKARKSIKLTAARRNQITNAITQAEAGMTDSIDEWEQVAVEWTNETDQVAELYVRCAAENALGSVWAVPEWMVGYQNRWSSMSIS